MKKETLKDTKHNCEGCQSKGYLDETDGYYFGKAVCPVCVNDKEPKQEHFQEMNDFMIKETLEEVAETELYLTINKIIDGGKDLPKGYNVSRAQAINYAFDIAVKIAKWQAERSFTLEQIDELFFGDEEGYFDDFLDYRLGLTGSQGKNKITFKEWFEKFKKK